MRISDWSSDVCSSDLSKGGWTADWIFVDDGRVLSKWSDSKSDARRAMASGADGAADALTKRYAKRSPAGPPGTYRATFTGIHTGPDYLRLSPPLPGMSVVRGLTPLPPQPRSGTRREGKEMVSKYHCRAE